MAIDNDYVLDNADTENAIQFRAGDESSNSDSSSSSLPDSFIIGISSLTSPRSPLLSCTIPAQVVCDYAPENEYASETIEEFSSSSSSSSSSCCCCCCSRSIGIVGITSG